MTFVIGRGEGESLEERPAGKLGTYRALDGSSGAPLYIDLDRPHAMLVVGKRGYGKSYTLGVIAEGLARAEGVAPVVVDPMGVFDTLADESRGSPVPAAVMTAPPVRPNVLDPRSWCTLLELSPESGAGGLVWQAAEAHASLAGMRQYVANADAPGTDKRAAINHLDLADSWGVFDETGVSAADLAGPEISVVDVSELDSAPMNAVARAVGEALYRARIERKIDRLPWLLFDEVHTFFDGVASAALETILTRGRAPGVSLVMATQRPSAVPPVGVSQSDVIVSHRLTSGADIEALKATQPTYMDASLEERMPTETGDVIVIDDATETVHAATVRRRDTPHGGDSPRASEL
ncbi:ATP-binding protein [Halapricum hydrolyticum]|uniref:ATP-binding protein n=1 Tax=Halapricum hydrolyticum TaxID=2979991 RepID=A0AAE3IA46_9EURY|nr:ATP-binding protein [Halapricum hydrolyticum]MCU4717566.1 ATP-binding protein [Halapricum hydrolyticum]MCU4726730.1 ATP-binding protein [Halapricum hydrolyticum]